MILISKEQYANLLRADIKLNILEKDGVDNWSWYMEGSTAEEDEMLYELSDEELIKKIGNLYAPNKE